jgi:hypothetical protein
MVSVLIAVGRNPPMANSIIAYEVAIINDPNASIGDKVDAAAKLWQLIVASGQTSITINGNGLSQCKVTVPKPFLKLEDGLTVDDERTALGELFDAIYEVKLQLHKNDPTFLATFPQSVQAHMAGVTTFATNTPRVSLRTLPGVEEIK